LDVCPFEVLEAYWTTEGAKRRIQSRWSLRQAEDALRAKGVEISRETIRRIIGVRMSGRDSLGEEHGHHVVASYGGECLPSWEGQVVLRRMLDRENATEEWQEERGRSVIVVNVHCTACWQHLMKCPNSAHDHSCFVVRFLLPNRVAP
jgi:hypothetical protein